MTAQTEPVSLDEQRSRLTLRASAVRTRLLQTIDALDTRRQNVRELGNRAKRLALPLAATLLCGVAVGAGLVFAMRARVARRREHRLADRLARVIAPLRLVEKPSFWRAAARKVLFNTVIIVTSELARRGAKALIARRPLALEPAREGDSRPASAEGEAQPVVASPAPSWNLD